MVERYELAARRGQVDSVDPGILGGQGRQGDDLGGEVDAWAFFAAVLAVAAVVIAAGWALASWWEADWLAGGALIGWLSCLGWMRRR